MEYHIPQGDYEANFDNPKYVEWYLSGTISRKDDILNPYKFEAMIRQPANFDPDGELAQAYKDFNLTPPEPNESFNWEIVSFVNLGQ